MQSISETDILNNLLTLIPAGIFWKDKERRFLGANQMFLDYYGLESVSELIGKTDEDMGWHIDPEPFRTIEMRILDTGESELNVPGQCIVKGKVRKIRASKCPLKSNGEIVGLVGYFLDVTDEQDEMNRLSVISHTDELTGILNRRAFTDIAAQYEAQYKKDGSDFVLFMIDLDNFKDVNDDYGHEFGNYALIAVCKSLTGAVADNSVLFRYGGDEFVVLHQYKDTAEIEQLRKRLSSAIDSPRNLDGTKISIKASIGHSVFSEALYLSDLVEIADRRMYEMKKHHKSGV